MGLQLWVAIEGNGKKMEGSLYHFKSNWWVINNMLGKFEHLNVRWEWLNEKKGVEAKDCDEFELMKMIVPLLIFIVEISDTDRRNRVYWSHSLIFRRHSHYCTSIQTSLQFIIHINSSISYQPVRNVQIVFCSVSINHNLLLHTEQLESMWIQP